MDSDLFKLAMEGLEPFTDCDAKFANALSEFKSTITPSHNVTTRNLWNLIRQHLDEPLNAIIGLEDCELAQQLLSEFKLSTIGHTNPNYSFNADQWAAQKLVDPRHAITPDLVCKLKNITESAKTADIDVETIFYNMELWYQNIRFAIHCAQDQLHREMIEIIMRDNPSHPLVIESLKKTVDLEDFFSPAIEVDLPVSFKQKQHESYIFCATLDTVINLISTLDFFKPQRVPYKDFGLQSYKKTYVKNSNYCELCWRNTINTVDYMLARETSTEHNFRLNNQYCYYHDPSNPASQYKADLPYREVFQQELKAKKWRQTSSSFVFQFPLDDFSAGYEKDARKAIYDLVHAKLRPMRGKNKMVIGLKEQVFSLRVHEKLNFDAIAIKLNTSKYSVKRAWKELEYLFALRQRESFVSDYTGEVIDALPMNDSIRILEQVNNLLAKNTSLVEIANQTQLFTYTVRAIQIRLAEIKVAQSKIDGFKTQFAQYPDTELIIEKLDEIKNEFEHFYNTGTKLMLIRKIEKDLGELRLSRKKLTELFISKLIQPLH